jgi:hypothetical protein
MVGALEGECYGVGGGDGGLMLCALEDIAEMLAFMLDQ